MNDNIIQQARDVLAKWRGNANALPWYFDGRRTVWGGDDLAVASMTSVDTDAHLVVGTAGNPDLLDALVGMLAAAVLVGRWESEFLAHAKRLAAAIIAADERMTS